VTGIFDQYVDQYVVKRCDGAVSSLLFSTLGVWSSLPGRYLSKDLSINSWLFEYIAVCDGVICVSKDSSLFTLPEGIQSFLEEE
jgi:hypothetical protein